MRTQPETASRLLARFAIGLRLAQIPPTARSAACRHLLDGLGTALAAVRLGQVPAARAVASAMRGDEATLLDGTRTSALGAALGNGALIHALDFDDTHPGGLVHATAVTLPALLAVGEETGASGVEMLCAAVAGYETITRIAAAAPHSFHARGVHATSVCGVFSAAIVASRLYGLDEDQAVHALGIAGSLAAGSLEFLVDGSSTKQLHPGFAAHGGVLAARLAARGATGPATILEGTSGLFAMLAGRRVPTAAIVAALGESWEVTRMAIKPYPICQLSVATVAAAAAVREQVSTDAIALVTAELPPETIAIVAEPTGAKRRPRTPYEAKFSLPWCVATMLVDGAIGVDHFAADSLARPAVLALADVVEHRIAAWAKPAADAPGSITVELEGGDSRTSRVEHAPGTPDEPLDLAAIRDKFSRNVGDPGRAARLADRMLALGEAASAADLLQPLLASEAAAR